MQDPHHSSSEVPEDNSRDYSDFPWWLPVVLFIVGWLAYLIITEEGYGETYNFIIDGIWITIKTSLISYFFAMILGLLAGLGRISRNIVIRNIATLYVELVRGIPMLVLIFYVTLVLIPYATDTIVGWGFEAPTIDMNSRAILALSVTYGAFLAEIFRAGIQSIGAGQTEAARSLGMSYGQAMRYIILPQAIRNVLPALGNDFIAMLKDSSLVAVLGVRDITQSARVYAGSSFKYREAFNVLAALYLSMTVALSFVMKAVERRLRRND